MLREGENGAEILTEGLLSERGEGGGKRLCQFCILGRRRILDQDILMLKDDSRLVADSRMELVSSMKWLIVIVPL